MDIEFRFRSLTDWSGTNCGHALIGVLKAFGLEVERADIKEPIRRKYTPESIEELWRPNTTEPQLFSLLLEGQTRYRFAGFVHWMRGTSPTKKVFNTLRLTMSFPARDRPAVDWFLGLGDTLFLWSDAVQGFITEPTKYRPDNRPIAVRHYIEGLFWVNYFGEAYVAEPSLAMPLQYTAVGRGIRTQLADDPLDSRLDNEDYLHGLKDRMGLGWFGEGPRAGFRLPALPFDRLWRSARPR